LSFAEKMMGWDMLNYLPDDILTKVDRACMSVSLEGRIPMLDHRVVEFACRTPLHLKVRNGQRKWLLRQVLYRYVPCELIERPKKGFSVPIRQWLVGPLRDWAEALLDVHHLQQEGVFNVDIVCRAWRDCLAGHGNQHHVLWHVLMFQAWQEAMGKP
jgi:asparagine synthase (glutamine-hydrolysing)